MGSKPLFLLSTITAVLAGTVITAVPTSAMSQLPDGINVWTVDELINVNHEMTIERDSICGEDESCRREVYISQIARGGIYNAVDSMNRETLLVTSVVADDRGVFKVLFHEQDLNEWLASGSYVIHQPREMHFSTTYGDVDFESEDYLNAVRTGYDPNGQVQFIYGAGFVPEVGDLFPSDEEVDMYTSYMGYYLADNPKLHYTLINEDWRYDGIADYSACADTIWFSECKLVYDETGQYRYVPAVSLMEPGSVTTESETTGSTEEPNLPEEFNLPEESEKLDEAEINGGSEYISEPDSSEETENVTENQSDLSDLDSLENPENTVEPDNSKEITNPNDIDTDNQKNVVAVKAVVDELETSSKSIAIVEPVVEKAKGIKAPETGAPDEGQDYAVELPWWLVVIFALGGITFLWLFFPIRRKK